MSSNPISEWIAGASLPRKLIAACTLSNFGSQFLLYSQSRDSGYLATNSDFDTKLYLWSDFAPTGTGWQLHPAAPWVLGFAAVIQFTDLAEDKAISKWQHWIVFVLVFFATTPAQVSAPGGKIGLLSWFAIFWLAIWQTIRLRNASKEKKAAEFQL